MKPINLHMYKEGGRLKFYPYQRTIYDAWVSKLDDDQPVEMQLKKQRKKKTAPQLGYWFGVLIPFAVDALREAGHDTLFDISVGDLKTGVETDKDTTDLLLKTLYKVNTSADKVPLKRNMTTEQMSELIDFSLRWLAENLGVYCPTPKE